MLSGLSTKKNKKEKCLKKYKKKWTEGKMTRGELQGRRVCSEREKIINKMWTKYTGKKNCDHEWRNCEMTEEIKTRSK